MAAPITALGINVQTAAAGAGRGRPDRIAPCISVPARPTDARRPSKRMSIVAASIAASPASCWPRDPAPIAVSISVCIYVKRIRARVKRKGESSTVRAIDVHSFPGMGKAASLCAKRVAIARIIDVKPKPARTSGNCGSIARFINAPSVAVSGGRGSTARNTSVRTRAVNTRAKYEEATALGTLARCQSAINPRPAGCPAVRNTGVRTRVVNARAKHEEATALITLARCRSAISPRPTGCPAAGSIAATSRLAQRPDAGSRGARMEQASAKSTTGDASEGTARNPPSTSTTRQKAVFCTWAFAPAIGVRFSTVATSSLVMITADLIIDSVSSGAASGLPSGLKSTVPRITAATSTVAPDLAPARYPVTIPTVPPPAATMPLIPRAVSASSISGADTRAVATIEWTGDGSKGSLTRLIAMIMLARPETVTMFDRPVDGTVRDIISARRPDAKISAETQTASVRYTGAGAAPVPWNAACLRLRLQDLPVSPRLSCWRGITG